MSIAAVHITGEVYSIYAIKKSKQEKKKLNETAHSMVKFEDISCKRF